MKIFKFFLAAFFLLSSVATIPYIGMLLSVLSVKDITPDEYKHYSFKLAMAVVEMFFDGIVAVFLYKSARKIDSNITENK